jgi:hypothetical protein
MEFGQKPAGTTNEAISLCKPRDTEDRHRGNGTYDFHISQRRYLRHLRSILHRIVARLWDLANRDIYIPMYSLSVPW